MTDHNSKPTVTIVFPTKEYRDSFLGWFSYGGGEYEFMESSKILDDVPIDHFDYSKAFKAWGYNPKRDGQPVIIAEVIDEDTDHD